MPGSGLPPQYQAGVESAGNRIYGSLHPNGATFISDILAARLPSFENLVYYKLSGEAARRTVYFYYKKHKNKSKAMEEFIRMMHG